MTAPPFAPIFGWQLVQGSAKAHRIVAVARQRQKSTTVYRNNLTDGRYNAGLTILLCSIAS
jgi:hypothetical protein